MQGGVIRYTLTPRCCSAREICPYRRCKTCEVKYQICPVKCCLNINRRLVCCGDTNNNTKTDQDLNNNINDDRYKQDSFDEQYSEDYRTLNEFSNHMYIVIGVGAAVVLLILLTCTVCLVHARTKRIRGNGPYSERQQRRRHRQEPSIAQYSLEMCSVRKPPPYAEYPPSYSQVVSEGNTDHNKPDDALHSETSQEMCTQLYSLPPQYNEISETLPAQRDIPLQRY
ncbi:hypothetical protein CHS0354_001638 [Potamilus streckersoni]|uniref:Uncharacterized protein n=1 Tax=Potamilus streckersoni TaxID=2493646 RepID=A0AAE0WCP4_9BIVA|nr:hypothetical protein CHS0354_001638 [Potamilus streckersoni]